MNTSKQIEIPLNKIKLTLMLLSSIIFCGAGIWFEMDPPGINTPILGNPITIFIFGLAIILFSGLAGFILFKKLSDSSFGLIISDEGVVDNSSGISAGFVPWTDITAIKETRVFNQRFINLVVKNPQDYIARQKSFIKRKLVQSNYSSFGTAISISANGLKCNQSELKVILDNKFAGFNNKKI